MGLIDIARDTLRELPVSDVIRERLSLALDQASSFERQVGELQEEKGRLQARLEHEQADHEQTKRKLRELEESLTEETRFVLDVEFKRGAQTGNEWKPFCPKCHLPLSAPETAEVPFACSDRRCGWVSHSNQYGVRAELAALAPRRLT